MEISEEGKAMKFYEVNPFELRLTPSALAAVAPTLAGDGDDEQAGG